MSTTSTENRNPARATVNTIADWLRYDGFLLPAIEAGYRESDPLPQTAAHERARPEVREARDERALLRTARAIKTASRGGALLWTADRVTTTDASRLDLRREERLDDDGLSAA